MAEDAPETRTHDDVVTHFRRLGAPELKKTAVLVIIGGRMYRREGEMWYLLENRPRHPRTPDA